MKILLTGATGYIGRRLLPELLASGHSVVCSVRDKARFDHYLFLDQPVEVIEVDFLDKTTLSNIPADIEAAYYLIHSMNASTKSFDDLEERSARHFVEGLKVTQVKQVIYLSGIVNESKLSKHLSSRKSVEDELNKGPFSVTTLRAGIIVGSGSASFEIIRDLVEKLPIMIAPKWLKTKTQPIAIRNVLAYLKGVLGEEKTFNDSFDIGGPDVLSYKDMLMTFSKVRKLNRRIYTVPVMTPKLSSYWLYFVTSTSYKLATNLVNSMGVETVVKDHRIEDIIPLELIPYERAVEMAFSKIAAHQVPSSWKDAQSSRILSPGISNLIEVPKFGTFKDARSSPVKDSDKTIEKIWQIGGKNGWYYANILWRMRGLMDKMVGGVGLRRGRRNDTELEVGDALDFWRVLYADKNEQRLLLYAEMKLPGEAWLEFKIENGMLHQIATFRPLGIMGRLYWYAVLPFHGLIFNGMIKRIAV